LSEVITVWVETISQSSSYCAFLLAAFALTANIDCTVVLASSYSVIITTMELYTHLEYVYQNQTYTVNLAFFAYVSSYITHSQLLQVSQ
jgi:hypothetical protein